MITKDKVSEILYIIDEFECQTFKKLYLPHLVIMV